MLPPEHVSRTVPLLRRAMHIIETFEPGRRRGTARGRRQPSGSIRHERTAVDHRIMLRSTLVIGRLPAPYARNGCRHGAMRPSSAPSRADTEPNRSIAIPQGEPSNAHHHASRVPSASPRRPISP